MSVMVHITTVTVRLNKSAIHVKQMVTTVELIATIISVHFKSTTFTVTATTSKLQ
jgi:hypothetical protein